MRILCAALYIISLVTVRQMQIIIPAVATLSPAPVPLHAEASEVDWVLHKPKKNKVTRRERMNFINACDQLTGKV